ncbi:hydrolase 1, exosortase A system-associated [Massilia sp. TN1-12]|uniref:hydrolase 1, exosortase A system-associated n=1 Tax=Massilia paldalensis TaxID=3377675 RepID=UPI003850CE3C
MLEPRVTQQALAFPCEGDTLYGVLHLPARPAPRGVVIVVGGPQYRAGSHRQFVLLARTLAARGIPVLRFDYRGMGDSEGEPRVFDAVDADLRAAIDALFAHVPGLRDVALWGLCDGASASVFYAGTDHRVAGIALLNPWVRTEEGAARATLKHYYRARLFDPALWRKIASGRFDLRAALASAWGLVRRTRRPVREDAATLPERMYTGLSRFDGRVLMMLSGADLTAREFADVAGGSANWRALLATPRVTRHLLDGADHTCSRAAWREQVETWTCDWLAAW